MVFCLVSIFLVSKGVTPCGKISKLIITTAIRLCAVFYDELPFAPTIVTVTPSRAFPLLSSTFPETEPLPPAGVAVGDTWGIGVGCAVGDGFGVVVAVGVGVVVTWYVTVIVSVPEFPEPSVAVTVITLSPADKAYTGYSPTGSPLAVPLPPLLLLHVTLLTLPELSDAAPLKVMVLLVVV